MALQLHSEAYYLFYYDYVNSREQLQLPEPIAPAEFQQQ